MVERSILPSPVLTLGEALRPIAGEVEARLGQRSVRRQRLDNAGEFLTRHLRGIEEEVEALVDVIDRELGPAVAAGTHDADIWRAVARAEVRIERLLDNRDEVWSADCDAADAQGLRLLAAVYRNLLRQILAWLNEILELVDHPLAGLRRRGLATRGKVTPRIELRVEPPPELDSLTRWADQRADELEDLWDEEAERSRSRSDLGALALVLGAFGLGWLLGGDDE